MKTVLTIGFPESQLEVDNPSQCPNIGDAIDNPNVPSVYFYVESKEFYYSKERVHIIIEAKQKQL